MKVYSYLIANHTFTFLLFVYNDSYMSMLPEPKLIMLNTLTDEGRCKQNLIK